MLDDRWLANLFGLLELVIGISSDLSAMMTEIVGKHRRSHAFLVDKNSRDADLFLGIKNVNEDDSVTRPP